MNISVQSYDFKGRKMCGTHEVIIRHYNSLQSFKRYWLFNKNNVWLKNEFNSGACEVKVFSFTNVFDEKTYTKIYSIKKEDIN